MSIQTTVRMLLALGLLVGVYSETGKWTTICMFLSFVASEAQAYLLRK